MSVEITLVMPSVKTSGDVEQTAKALVHSKLNTKTNNLAFRLTTLGKLIRLLCN
jgi:hypothetical protein